MYLYDFSSRGTIGQAPAIGEIVNGTQQLRSDVASNILTFLQNRFLLIDPTSTGVAGSVGYVAVTPEGVRAAGAQLEGLPTAAQNIGELSAQYIPLVNIADTMAVLQAKPPSLYHMIIVDSQAAAQTLAQPNSNWAVLQPRGAPAQKPVTTAKPASPATPILVGAGVLALIALIASAA